MSFATLSKFNRYSLQKPLAAKKHSLPTRCINLQRIQRIWNKMQYKTTNDKRIKHVAFNEALFPCYSYIRRSFRNSIFPSLTVEKPVLQSWCSHIWGKVFPLYMCIHLENRFRKANIFFWFYMTFNFMTERTLIKTKWK